MRWELHRSPQRGLSLSQYCIYLSTKPGPLQKHTHACTPLTRCTQTNTKKTHTHTHLAAKFLLKLQSTPACMHTPELLAVENACFWLSQGYCGSDAEVLRGGQRVNIGGWMRQSAAFTYRWGEESGLPPFHGSLHLQKWDWRQFSERCGIPRCVQVCECGCMCVHV